MDKGFLRAIYSSWDVTFQSRLRVSWTQHLYYSDLGLSQCWQWTLVTYSCHQPTRQARWQNSLCSPRVVLVPLCNLVLQKPGGPASLLPVSWILEQCPGTHPMRDTQVDTLGQTLGTAYPTLSVLPVPRIGQILSRWTDLGPLPWLFPNALYLSAGKLWLINCLN